MDLVNVLDLNKKLIDGTILSVVGLVYNGENYSL